MLTVTYSRSIHVLVVGVEGSGHHTIGSMTPPGWTNADWSPEIFLNGTGGYVTNVEIMDRAIINRWGYRNVAHIKNSFPMNLPRDLLNHPDLFTFIHCSSIEPRLLFLRRDLVSATFSSARRFIETPNMRYELQIAENEAMIIEASYAQSCSGNTQRCHVVDYAALCSKDNAASLASLVSVFSLPSKHHQKAVEMALESRTCAQSGHDYSTQPNFTELAVTYNPRVVLYPHAAIPTPLKDIGQRPADSDVSKFIDNAFENATLTRHCEKADYFSGQEQYRLGDMFKGQSRHRSQWAESDHRSRFPHSLATEYMNLVPRGSSSAKILANLIEKRRSKISLNATAEALPTPGELVIHVRIGDVIELANRTVKEMLHRPTYFYDDAPPAPWHQYVKPLAYFKDIILQSKHFKRVAIVAASHIKLSSYPKSCQYLTILKSYFDGHGFENVRLRTGRLPDDDVIFMTSASAFLPSGGTFSKMIAKIVSLNGGEIVYHPHMQSRV